MAKRSKGSCGKFKSKAAKRRYEAYKHIHGLAKSSKRRKGK